MLIPTLHTVKSKLVCVAKKNVEKYRTQKEMEIYKKSF